MYRRLIIIALAFLLPLSIQGQKKKRRVVKKPVPVVVEQPEEDPRISDMRQMTQQIVIIDSLVCDKNTLLSAIHLSAETGHIGHTSEILPEVKADSCLSFVNQMGDKSYFSRLDVEGHQQLYTSDRLGNRWSDPKALRGISEGISEAAYPFMLNDGITLYFAGRGEESIGGYDIFLTRYDSRSGAFFKPENVGMPFNSEANDYLMVINEPDSIGYFVSDRRQPEGKVCVYTFIPSGSRHTYDTNAYTDEQIHSFADIQSIRDTWGNGKAREAALLRLRHSSTQPSTKQKPADITFVINDNTVYSRKADFRSAEARSLLADYQRIQKQLDDISLRLDKARDYWHKASTTDKLTLRKEVLTLEEQTGLLNQQLHVLEKRIRKSENAVLNQ